MSSLTVNRYLDDPAMDDIDHALGRPLDPMAETYRNYYAIDTDSEIARAFEASPCWTLLAERMGMATFEVFAAGRAALRDHLILISEPHRRFAVIYEGLETQVAAKSKSAARYVAYLQADWNELSFGDFIRASHVRCS